MATKTIKVDPVLRLKAMADEQRLRILAVLQDGEICVGDLVTLLGSPQPTVSRNLAILRSTGLVTVRRSGLWAFYDLDRDGGAFHAALLDALRACSELPRHARDREEGMLLRTVTGCCPEKEEPGSCGR